VFKQSCIVFDNQKVAPGHWLLELRSKQIAKSARPGQFVQILCTDNSCEPFLPRPFSFLNAKNGTFSILYHVVGKGTEFLSKKKKGELLNVLGPLGNGFTLKPSTAGNDIILVGGGVGIPPLYHLAETMLKNKIAIKKRIKVLLGARNKSLLLCEKDFKKLGIHVSVATDDGTQGHHGFITELLNRMLRAPNSGLPACIFTCGPTPMLKTVSMLAKKIEVPCEVSVEVPMACGFGACLGCAIKVSAETSYRFATACTEGPVFQASDLVWD
jgi:dihydroorotate dehydrogenase electron transfer subunit